MGVLSPAALSMGVLSLAVLSMGVLSMAVLNPVVLSMARHSHNTVEVLLRKVMANSQYVLKTSSIGTRLTIT